MCVGKFQRTSVKNHSAPLWSLSFSDFSESVSRICPSTSRCSSFFVTFFAAEES